jgi:hypothetical protein
VLRRAVQPAQERQAQPECVPGGLEELADLFGRLAALSGHAATSAFRTVI